MIEEWVPCPFDPVFEVSDRGNFRRKGRTRLLYAQPEVGRRTPYRRAKLSTGARVFVHVIVCTAFHGPKPNDRPLVCHRDDNTMNCAKGNLYWGTHSDNAKDAYRNDRLEHRKGYTHPLAHDPVKIERAKELLTAGWVQRRVMKELSLSSGVVSRLAKGSHHSIRVSG